MKRDVLSLIEEAKAKWGGYSAMLSYQLLNLCTEAEPAALLSFTVDIEDQSMPLEEVANVFLPRVDQYEIVPSTDEYIFPISKGIKEAHPEFDIQVKDPDESEADEEEGQDEGAGGEEEEKVKHLVCTVPPVNKDRHDTLVNGVKTACDAAKNSMDASNEEIKIRMKIALVGASDKEVDAGKKGLKTVYDRYDQYIQQQRESKLKEIDDAYERYLNDKDKKVQEQQEEEAANNKDAGKSIKMGDLGEDEY